VSAATRAFALPPALVIAAFLAATVASASDERPESLARPSVPVEGPPPPRISLQALPAYGTAPLTVGFFVSSYARDGDRVVAYRWSFGDGAVSTLPPHGLFHIYRQPGNYLASVTVTTSRGRIATAFKAIVVRPSATR
jgi:PKD repeat protein